MRMRLQCHNPEPTLKSGVSNPHSWWILAAHWLSHLAKWMILHLSERPAFKKQGGKQMRKSPISMSDLCRDNHMSACTHSRSNMDPHLCISYVSCCCDLTLQQKQHSRKGLIWLMVLRHGRDGQGTEKTLREWSPEWAHTFAFIGPMARTKTLDPWENG